MTMLSTRYMKLRDHLTEDFLGGPKILSLAWAINLQKGGTLAFVLSLMAMYTVWTPTAWVYFCLHGSYGLISLLKELVFPNSAWQKRITIGGAANA